LRRQGQVKARLYGADDTVLGGLNSFYLLLDKPEVYGLPSNPKLPSRSVPKSALWSIFAAFLTALGVLFAFRGRTNGKTAKASAPEPPKGEPAAYMPPPAPRREVTSPGIARDNDDPKPREGKS